jgi:hypothetical protein
MPRITRHGNSSINPAASISRHLATQFRAEAISDNRILYHLIARCDNPVVNNWLRILPFLSAYPATLTPPARPASGGLTASTIETILFQETAGCLQNPRSQILAKRVVSLELAYGPPKPLHCLTFVRALLTGMLALHPSLLYRLQCRHEMKAKQQ